MWEFLRFELREQMRSGLLWMFALFFGLLAFGAMSSEAVQVGGGAGGVFKNAPTVVINMLGVFSLLGLLALAGIVAHALLGDFELGTADLVFSQPIRKRDYLLGRMLAAFIASVVVFLVILGGMVLAEFMPWIDPERLGPTPWMAYAWALCVVVLPNVVFALGLLSVLAVTTRSILWIYIGLLGFIVGWAVSQTLMRDLDNVWVAVMLDPLGARAFSRTIRYWATEQRNHAIPELSRYILANRALWLAIGVALVGASFALFRTERTGTGKGWRWRRKSATQAPAEAAPVARPAQVPAFAPSRGPLVTARQFGSMLWFDTTAVLKSVPLIVMLLFGLANFVPTLVTMDFMYGTPTYPVTSRVADMLQAAYSWLLVIVVLFYAGELAARPRVARVNEVTDAMPTPDWMPVLAKLGALFLVIVVFQAAGALFGMGWQVAHGVPVEPVTWIKILLNGSIFYGLMAMLALALQGITHNKFAGYALVIVVLIAQGVLDALDFSHNLYIIGGAPNAPWSDMNGYGHFLPGQLWFQAYWALFMAALLAVATALWVRGTETTWGRRMKAMRARLRGPVGGVLAVSLVAFVTLGSWLFWNTNIRNEYVAPDDERDLLARYEREYKQYQDLPQPKIEAAHVDVDLWPETQTMRANGVFRIFNPHDTAIRDIHIQLMDAKALQSIDFGGQTLATYDEPLGYRIYRLDVPMQPGEEREMRFTVDYHPNGITNGRAQTAIVGNGTFFNSRYFPGFGYEPGRELEDRNERRKRGLGEPTRMPKLEDVGARQATYLTDDADWIDYSATICTAPGQIALSPGKLQRTFDRDGRRCYAYEMDQPMLNFYSVLSARYTVARGEYEDVPIEVYYDPKHHYNVQRMIEATRKSLAYYEQAFASYQFDQVRILEFPRYASFAQSFANTIPFSESIGFIADLTREDTIDYVFYVTAHEVAHQWWGHQVAGANSQGGPVLVESLAQYSALMVMEREYGRERMRQFLKYELDRYLSGRGGERLEELPLYRSENQSYIHYNKGSLVFYRLREEMGEKALNRALSRFLMARRFGMPPYPTSLDLLHFIREEAGPDQQQLTTDLFEKITLYDNRVTEATAKKLGDGRYEVTMTLHAAKLYADGKGRETPAAMDDRVEIGVFARGPSGKERDEKVLYLEPRRIRAAPGAADQVVTVVVDARPDSVGFDPYNKLIDKVSADNRKSVTIVD